MWKSTLKTTIPLVFRAGSRYGHRFCRYASPTGPEVADAAQRQDNAAVREFIRQRVPVNTPQADGTTALQWAAHWTIPKRSNF